jgi:predicted nuclease of predicted toxin-antitoxin system
MRIVIDEDIPRELTPLFKGPGLVVEHIDAIGLKGAKNGVLLAALSGTCDILVTGDTNLGHQQNLARFDLAVVLLHPARLVVEQIKPLIPLAVAAFPMAPKHVVTAIRPPRPTQGRVHGPAPPKPSSRSESR